MRARAPIRIFVDYLTSGIACGLFGVLAFGLPSLVLLGLLYAAQRYLIRHGLPVADTWGWLTTAFATTFPALPRDLILTAIFFSPPALGFLYGWWAGMYKQASTRHARPPSQWLRRMEQTRRSAS
jgi:hypothetical protein